ncbi:MAG: sorbosone dehydrogenase family protein, partial [Chitinophagales bacterium]
KKMKTHLLLICLLTTSYHNGCHQAQEHVSNPNADSLLTSDQAALPEPFATKSVRNFTKVIGWPEGTTPIAPKGFSVTLFAKDFINPRNIFIAPNGDVFVAEANTELSTIKKVGADVTGISKSQRFKASANRITLLRDTDKDGFPDFRSVYLADLNQPYGILILNNSFYVANTDGVWKYPYNADDTVMRAAGKLIVVLPAGGYNNHWTRNIIVNRDKSKILIAVGSSSNAGENGMENEIRRAAILEINPDGSGERIFANGLRNPNGIAIQPETGVLFTAVNERDGLGDDLVPDYFTSVQEGGFYGWPYSYFGQHQDPRMKDNPRPDLVSKAIVPDVALGSHVAALGLAFYQGSQFPERFRDGAFIGEHGSWNRSVITGYKVVFIPFHNGKPGKPEDFLTGFIANEKTNEVHGRPVNLAVLPDGSLLLADDTSNTLWRISYNK